MRGQSAVHAHSCSMLHHLVPIRIRSRLYSLLRGVCPSLCIRPCRLCLSVVERSLWLALLHKEGRIVADTGFIH